jgi:hypothetical protein
MVAEFSGITQRRIGRKRVFREGQERQRNGCAACAPAASTLRRWLYKEDEDVSIKNCHGHTFESTIQKTVTVTLAIDRKVETVTLAIINQFSIRREMSGAI